MTKPVTPLERERWQKVVDVVVVVLIISAAFALVLVQPDHTVSWNQLL